MGNIWAIENMLGITMDENFKVEKDICVNQAAKSSAALIKQFSKCRQVANTFRFDNGDKLNYYSTLYRDGRLTVSGEYTTGHIIDKVGSGDCFMAGLIYGNMNNHNDKDTLEFATAAAVDKMFVLGDATTSSVDDILKRQS